MKFLIVGLSLLFLFSSIRINAQEKEGQSGSVIRTLTPSKLIAQGQYDIKFFNSLYTETEDTFGPGGENRSIPRNSFFTSTLEAYTGVSESRRVNLGFIVKFRSSVIGGADALDVFKFAEEAGVSRSGLTSFAPSVKWVPFEQLTNFSLQSSLFVPLLKN